MDQIVSLLREINSGPDSSLFREINSGPDSELIKRDKQWTR